ncbi:hypothetical protein GTW59_21935 [Streptomyces sp. SID89]|nr:hypothetical protein [Streptomyces sp. SID89]
MRELQLVPGICPGEVADELDVTADEMGKTPFELTMTMPQGREAGAAERRTNRGLQPVGWGLSRRFLACVRTCPCAAPAVASASVRARRAAGVRIEGPPVGETLMNKVVRRRRKDDLTEYVCGGGQR